MSLNYVIFLFESYARKNFYHEFLILFKYKKIYY